MQEAKYFETGQQLPTLYKRNNLTVNVESVNNTSRVVLDSAGASATIITPPRYACNVSFLTVFDSCC